MNQSLVSYSNNHCLQKFLDDFEDSLIVYNCFELKTSLSDGENTYYKAIKGKIVNKTSDIEEFVTEQKLNGSCYLENFSREFSILTYNLVYQINASIRSVQKELNRKLNVTKDIFKFIGVEIKTEILKCNQN